MDEPQQPTTLQEISSRQSRLESVVSALSATVEGLAEEWKTERGDMRSAINALREGKQTNWSVILGAAGFVAVLAAMLSGLVVREISHVEAIADTRQVRTQARFDKLEQIVREDHDETVKNAERWRLLESGLLRPPASWRLLEQTLSRGLPVHVEPSLQEPSPDSN